MGRNEQSDTGRRGGASSKTKASEGSQAVPAECKGEWAPAYGGSAGVADYEDEGME